MSPAGWKQRWREASWQAVMALHYDPALIGLAAAVLVLINGNLALSRQNVSAPVGSAPAAEASQSAFESNDIADKPEYLALARYLSHRYRIATDSAQSVVSAAYDAGEQFGLDPLLLLAVIAIESRFNPAARSVMGARGLMQIMPRLHKEKLVSYGGEVAVLDPVVNIELGAQILKEYIDRTGSLKAGLQIYNGARSDVSQRYFQKVRAEQGRLRNVVRELRRPAPERVVKLVNESLNRG
jgi:soluble lytic murein transglycosylase-like protein